MALACWRNFLMIKSDLDIVYGFIIVAITGAIHQSRYRTDISHSGSTDATWCHQTVQAVLYTQAGPQTDCGSNVAITRYIISLVFFLIIASLLDSQYMLKKALTWHITVLSFVVVCDTLNKGCLLPIVLKFIMFLNYVLDSICRVHKCHWAGQESDSCSGVVCQPWRRGQLV